MFKNTRRAKSGLTSRATSRATSRTSSSTTSRATSRAITGYEKKNDKELQSDIENIVDNIDKENKKMPPMTNMKKILDFFPKPDFEVVPINFKERHCGADFYRTKAYIPTAKQIIDFLQHVLDKKLVTEPIDNTNKIQQLMNTTFEKHHEMNRYIKSMCEYYICMNKVSALSSPNDTTSLTEKASQFAKNHEKELKMLSPQLTFNKKRKISAIFKKILKQQQKFRENKNAGGSYVAAAFAFSNFLLYIITFIVLLSSAASVSAGGVITVILPNAVPALLLFGAIISIVGGTGFIISALRNRKTRRSNVAHNGRSTTSAKKS